MLLQHENFIQKNEKNHELLWVFFAFLNQISGLSYTGLKVYFPIKVKRFELNWNNWNNLNCNLTIK